MSKVAIIGNTSGTGVFTVASPNSNVDRVLTLPDETGTVITTAGVPTSAMPAGSVIQVVNVLTTAQGSQALAAATETVVTGLTLSITPKGANSKFLVQARRFGESSVNWDNVYNILMNGVRVNIGGSTQSFAGLSMAGQVFGGGNDDISTPEILTLSTLVSTSSVVGTSITFALAITADTAKTLYLNRCVGAVAAGREVGSSEIIVTEIAQ
jgi:hypothetical protein